MPLSRRRTAPRGAGFHRPCGTRTEAKDTHGTVRDAIPCCARIAHWACVACNSRALPPCVNYLYENSRPCSHHPHLPSSSPICLHRFIFMMSHIPSSLSSKIYRAWFCHLEGARRNPTNLARVARIWRGDIGERMEPPPLQVSVHGRDRSVGVRIPGQPPFDRSYFVVGYRKHTPRQDP